MHWSCLHLPCQTQPQMGPGAALALLLAALTCATECQAGRCVAGTSDVCLFLHIQVALYSLTGTVFVGLLRSGPCGFRVSRLSPLQLLLETYFSVANIFRKLLFTQGQAIAILRFQ